MAWTQHRYSSISGGSGGQKAGHDTGVPLQPGKPVMSWATAKALWAPGQGKGFCSQETSPAVLHPAQEGYGCIREGPEGAT